MISCKEASELSIKRAEKNIGLRARFQLWMHVQACKLCKAFDAQSRWIGEMAGKISSNEKFTEAEKKELKDLISTQSNSNQ